MPPLKEIRITKILEVNLVGGVVRVKAKNLPRQGSIRVRLIENTANADVYRGTFTRGPGNMAYCDNLKLTEQARHEPLTTDEVDVTVTNDNNTQDMSNNQGGTLPIP
jgi:hypothetical protein